VSTQESLWRTAQPKRITLVYDTSEYVNTTENTVSTPTESSLEKLLHFVVALAETCALFILVIMKLIENIYLDIWPKKQCEVIKNQEFLAAMRRSAYSADYTRMSQCKQLTFTDYMRYIRTAKIDENKQFYVRQRAWWYANDKRRKDPTLPLTRPEIKNLRALMLLIDETDEEQRITKGEILRELGKFDEARACLESVDNPNLQTVVTFLMNCVKARDTTLHIIK
jgi:hypothetical protein